MTDDNHHLARRGDPETSAMSAAQLDLKDRHERILAALVSICPATDLEMAEALSARGFGREETCRRKVRTLREEHGRLVPALDSNGDQLRHLNSTGRWAECWTLGYVEPADRDIRDSVLARVARCEEVRVDEVEHVRFDGRDIYLAADLLDALTQFRPTPCTAPEDNDEPGEPGQIGLW